MKVKEMDAKIKESGIQTGKSKKEKQVMGARGGWLWGGRACGGMSIVHVHMTGSLLRVRMPGFCVDW